MPFLHIWAPPSPSLPFPVLAPHEQTKITLWGERLISPSTESAVGGKLESACVWQAIPMAGLKSHQKLGSCRCVVWKGDAAGICKLVYLQGRCSAA